MMDDFDFVDVEGDMEGELGRRGKKKDVLEEGMDMGISSLDYNEIE